MIKERRRSGARSQTRTEMLEVAANQPVNWLAQPAIFGFLSERASAWRRHAVLLANAWAVMCVACRRRTPQMRLHRFISTLCWREGDNHTPFQPPPFPKNKITHHPLTHSLAHLLPKLSCVIIVIS